MSSPEDGPNGELVDFTARLAKARQNNDAETGQSAPNVHPYETYKGFILPTIDVDLSPEQKQILAREAGRRGISREEFLAYIIRTQTGPLLEEYYKDSEDDEAS